MSKPSEGRFSGNEFYSKDVSAQDSKANDKIVEHLSSIPNAGGDKKVNNIDLENKNIVVEEEDKEFKEVKKDKTTSKIDENSLKSRDHKRKKVVTDQNHGMTFLRARLREMFIRRKLRENSEIFGNLSIYSRNKILNEAEYQGLNPNSSNAIKKMIKLARSAKEKVKDALGKLRKYFNHDYKDPRNALKDSSDTLNDIKSINIGGGINMNVSAKRLIEEVADVNIMAKVIRKNKKEFREEREEEALALKKEEQLKREFQLRKLKIKLLAQSKPIRRRRETVRNDISSFKPAKIERSLPSLKKFVELNGKPKIKSSWSSLVRNISHSAKSYSDRNRSKKLGHVQDKKTFRLPTSMLNKKARSSFAM